MPRKPKHRRQYKLITFSTILFVGLIKKHAKSEKKINVIEIEIITVFLPSFSYSINIYISIIL